MENSTRMNMRVVFKYVSLYTCVLKQAMGFWVNNRPVSFMGEPNKLHEIIT